VLCVSGQIAGAGKTIIGHFPFIISHFAIEERLWAEISRGKMENDQQAFSTFCISPSSVAN
jgi:hypothetical protein